jgi:hypothetical protein
LLDGNVKHHVPSPAVMAAWRFSFGDVQVKTKAEIDAFIEGAPVRARPTLVVDSGGRVLLIDDPLPQPPPDPGAGGAGGTSAVGAGGAGGEGSVANGAGGGSPTPAGPTNNDDNGAIHGSCAIVGANRDESSGRTLTFIGAGLLLAVARRRRRA